MNYNESDHGCQAKTTEKAFFSPYESIPEALNLPELAQYGPYSDDQLFAELQRRGVKRGAINRAIDSLPKAILSLHQRAVATAIATNIVLDKGAACTKNRAQIGRIANVSLATVDRFTSSGIGRAMFDNNRPADAHHYDANHRTFARQFLLYLLIIELYKDNRTGTTAQLRNLGLTIAPMLFAEVE